MFGPSSFPSSTPTVPSAWTKERHASGSASTQPNVGQNSMMQRSSPSSAQAPQQQQQTMDRQASFTFGGAMPQPFRAYQQQPEPSSSPQQSMSQQPFAQPSMYPQQQQYGTPGASGSSLHQPQTQPQSIGFGLPSVPGAGGQQSMLRSSSFRVPRRSDGTPVGAGASPMHAFNLGNTTDTQPPYGQSPQQQSKTVRWHDASQQPAEPPSIYPNWPSGSNTQGSPFQSQQQTHSGRVQVPASGFSQYTAPSQQGLQTPARGQADQRSTFSDALSSQSQPNSTWKTPSTQQHEQFGTPKSAFNTSLASMARPVTALTSAHKPQQVGPQNTPNIARISASSIAASVAAAAASASKVATANAGSKAAATQGAPQDKSTQANAVITPRPAIVARIKWNIAAIVLCWLVPRFGPMSAIYWTLLDITYKLSNGSLDLQLAAALSWMRTAIFLVAFVNLAEATIRLQTYPTSLDARSPVGSSQDASKSAATKRKPSLQHPPSRIASVSSSPSNSNAVSARNSRKSVPRQYAQDSPLRNSILRASVTSQQEHANRPDTSTILGTGRRLPSETPRFEGLRSTSASMRKPSSSATPLAAYLARKQERIASGQDFSDLSFEGSGGNSTVGDISNLSTDSIAIDRALRALSEDFVRESSQSRSSATPGLVT